MKPIQIIATIGPATKDTDVIAAMIRSDMSIARLNFSWGTHDEHRQFVKSVREVAKAAHVMVPILQDLSGPRIQQGAGHTFDSEVTVITEKDIADVKALADLEIEYVALSFVKDAEDVADLRTLLVEVGSQSKVIAKIERQEALDNLDEIIAAADGIMIARGDLGDAIPIETLPFVKKDILKRCNEAHKPAIVATEMLTSMIDSTDPSRADISDITHAVLDGASATMLSNETAVGTNPVKTVEVMRKVVDEAQRHTNVKVASF
jgi:pyruvate kinase